MKLIKIDKLEIKIFKKDDGDKAVECFKLHNKNKDRNNIDVIIIDLNMKEMNGDVACKIVFIYIIKDKRLSKKWEILRLICNWTQFRWWPGNNWLI